MKQKYRLFAIYLPLLVEKFKYKACFGNLLWWSLKGIRIGLQSLLSLVASFQYVFAYEYY